MPFNHVWVEGDTENPTKTLDSNTYGPICVNLINGRVEAVLWPRFKWLSWTDWESGKAVSDGYRQEVRNRVVKEAVKLQPPPA